MKWSIPAKTFLLGEYAAIAGSSAIVLTTSPCFELSLSTDPGLIGIHQDSPAGQFWMRQENREAGLRWHDPYQGRGGLGASSAQFVGAYLAAMHLQKKLVHRQEMLDAYWQCVAEDTGLRPSGYDVIAQSLQGCVYLNREKNICTPYPWPFKDIGFLLLHTGQKLATHLHLKHIALPDSIQPLTAIVDMASLAFQEADSDAMVNAVNAYHQQLAEMNLVAEHSLKHISFFQKQPDILAVKGCGAMGADVLLLLIPLQKQIAIIHRLSLLGWDILATSADLYKATNG